MYSSVLQVKKHLSACQASWLDTRWKLSERRSMRGRRRRKRLVLEHNLPSICNRTWLTNRTEGTELCLSLSLGLFLLISFSFFSVQWLTTCKPFDTHLLWARPLMIYLSYGYIHAFTCRYAISMVIGEREEGRMKFVSITFQWQRQKVKHLTKLK